MRLIDEVELFDDGERPFTEKVTTLRRLVDSDFVQVMDGVRNDFEAEDRRTIKRNAEERNAGILKTMLFTDSPVAMQGVIEDGKTFYTNNADNPVTAWRRFRDGRFKIDYKSARRTINDLDDAEIEKILDHVIILYIFEMPQNQFLREMI